MGNCRSIIHTLPDEQIAIIEEETGCRGYLDRDDFFAIRELAVNPLGDRIIDAFFDEAHEPDGKMTFEDFARVLAHFRPCKDNEETGVNSRRNKLKFAFAMYDLNKNGYITRHEFKVILIMMIGPQVSDQELECITDRTMQEGDYVKDGQISFEEFSRAMERLHIEELMSIRFED
uniref:EF-hand domain-containing protein n=1 Tax=Syphacia muris TaxID=451379 RepID=A0A0N5AQZ2_9BILA